MRCDSGRALVYDALGRDAEARVEITRAVEADAGASVKDFARHSLNKDRAGQQRALATLRRLGLPEEARR